MPTWEMMTEGVGACQPGEVMSEGMGAFQPGR